MPLTDEQIDFLEQRYYTLIEQRLEVTYAAIKRDFEEEYGFPVSDSTVKIKLRDRGIRLNNRRGGARNHEWHRRFESPAADKRVVVKRTLGGAVNGINHGNNPIKFRKGQD